MADGLVVSLKPSNSGGEKQPWFKENAISGENMVIDNRLVTPVNKVQKLQMALHTKAKAEPNYRFYTLWDKLYRTDELKIAYGKCRKNRGSYGVDKETFDDIENMGKELWLGKLQKELMTGVYQSQPLRRVWIPKPNSKSVRPLSIACIKDRVVQQAMLILLNPIFEADFLPEQYGFRKSKDAKSAVRRVYYNITDPDRTGIVDADLKEYFTTIPHGKLMRCMYRRIADKRALALIKQWLESPVKERLENGSVVTTTIAKDTHRGIPQGSPISPLLSNCYFRRFLLAWKLFGYQSRLDARIVNYADDFVICCKPQTSHLAVEAMENIIQRIGLQINKEKTSVVNLANKEHFDFLGYTLGLFINRDGKWFYGSRPSKKSLKKVIQKIHFETSRTWLQTTAEKRIQEINSILRGWCGYFNQGPVVPVYKVLRRYTERRLRRWLVKKHKMRGTTGYRQFSDKYLYGELGFYPIANSKADVPRAKV